MLVRLTHCTLVRMASPSTSSRVKSKHKLCPNEKGFCMQGEEPACALPPLAHLPDTHLQKYSLQTSIYNLMLHQTHGIDAGKRMYLLRMHTDRKGKHPGQPEYELVPCLDLRTEARDVLRFEAERLRRESRPSLLHRPQWPPQQLPWTQGMPPHPRPRQQSTRGRVAVHLRVRSGMRGRVSGSSGPAGAGRSR